MKCKNVILFYETHDDPSPSNVMIKLLDDMKQIGIKALCVEDPSDYDKKTTKNLLSKNIKTIFNYADSIKDVSHPYVKNMLNEGAILNQYTGEIMKPDDVLDEYTQNEVIDSAKDMIKGIAKAIQATLNLIKSAEKKKFSYFNIDMDSNKRAAFEQKYEGSELISIRDKVMADNLINLCNKGYDSVYLVGAMHFDVATQLRASNITVREYFIKEDKYNIKYEADKQYKSDLFATFCLIDQINHTFCKNHKFEGVIVNPFLDTNEQIDLIRQDLLGLSKANEDL